MRVKEYTLKITKLDNYASTMVADSLAITSMFVSGTYDFTCQGILYRHVNILKMLQPRSSTKIRFVSLILKEEMVVDHIYLLALGVAKSMMK